MCHVQTDKWVFLCGNFKKFKSWIILSMTEIRGSPPNLVICEKATNLNSISISHRISPSHRVRSFNKDFHFQRGQAIPIENLVSDLGYCMVGTRVGRNWWEKRRKRPGDAVEKRPRGKNHELTLGGGGKNHELTLGGGNTFSLRSWVMRDWDCYLRDRSSKLLPRIRFKEHSKLQLCFRRLLSSGKASSLVWSCEGFFAALVRVNGCVCRGVGCLFSRHSVRRRCSSYQIITASLV